MAGTTGVGAAEPPSVLLPALSAAHGEEPLIRKIITEQSFGSHVAEITFPSQVVLTSVRLGAVPSSGAQKQRGQVLLFAADASAPASSRFLQLCPGLEQPESGQRVLQLQPIVTTRVLLRGQYQTVPLSLYGYSLDEAAAAAPPLHQSRLTLTSALQWLREQPQQEEQHDEEPEQEQLGGEAEQQQQQQQQQRVWAGASTALQTAADGMGWHSAPLQPAAAGALAALVAYWGVVGTSERLMSLHPPPSAAFKEAAAVADAVCTQLVHGSWGRQPLPAAPSQQQQAGKEAGQVVEQAQGQQGGQQPADEAKAAADEQQQQQEEQEGEGQQAQPGQQASCAPLLEAQALLDGAADMVMGWCSMLGAGGAGRTASAVRCSCAGLAAAVLLCSCSEGSALMVARWGLVLLDDVCTMPQAPPSFVRHAVTACLLVARCCGTLGGAALLGSWKPPRGIVWHSQRRKKLLAIAAASGAAAGAGADAAGAAGSAGAGDVAAEAEAEATVAAEAEAGGDATAMEVDQQDEEAAAAAAVAAAAAELEHELYASHPSGSEEEEEEENEEAMAARARLQQQWQQERAAAAGEEDELLYGEPTSDEDEEGHGEELEGDRQNERGEEHREAQGHPDVLALYASSEEAAVPIEEDAPAAGELPQQQGGEAAGEPGTEPAKRAEEEEEFGADVYADLTPAQPGLEAQAEPTAGGAVVPAAAAPAGGTAAAAEEEGGGDDDADLYGDLGWEGATIPQIDGAADSPPRQRRRHRSSAAEPAERWEMGGDGADAGGSPLREPSRRSRRDRSSERGEERRKEKKEKKKKKDKSKEREGKKRRGREERRRKDREGERSPSSHRRHVNRVAEEERGRRRQQEEEEAQRRQQQREEEEAARRQQKQLEEEEARRRRKLQEEEEQARRRRRQKEAEEEARRQRRQQEEAVRRRRQEEEEALRRRRYQEQQRRLEDEQRAVEQEEEARRRKQQQQQQQQQRAAEEDAQRQRKRERSPAAATVGSGGRQRGEPEGKHPRTEAAVRQPLPPQQAPPRQPGPPQPARIEIGSPTAAAAAAAVSPLGQGRSKRWGRGSIGGDAAPVPVVPVALLDEAGRWQLYERQQQSRMQSYWLLKQRAYTGVSAHVAQHLLEQVQPARLALAARQLLHLLRAHEAAAAFQLAARQLVVAHQQQGEGMATPEASMLVAQCGSSLQQLAELLVKPLPTTYSSSGGAGKELQGGPPATDPPPPLLDAVSARRLLPLLAAVLHVPALHRAALQAQLPAAAAPQAALVEAALAQQLGVGARALLAVLGSSRGGRALLLGDAAVVEALLEATDAGCLAGGWRAQAGAEGAAVLQHLLLSEAVAAQLCCAPLDSQGFGAAADTAVALLRECGASGRAALVQALALRAPLAVPRLLLMLRMHCALLRAACGTGAAGTDASLAALRQRVYEPDVDLLLASAPACAPAGQLLLALLTAAHPAVLACWQRHAVAVHVAADAELRLLSALPEAASAMVGGLGAARSQLLSLKGGVAAVVTVHQPRGLSSLLTYLGAELPALVASTAGVQAAADEEGEGAGRPTAAVRTVLWSAVEELFCDPERLACCEQCLHLLASRLWAPGASGREAAYTLDGEGGLSVLLRGVLMGAELVVASAADDAWQGMVGHSIDVGEAAACRRRALSFLEAGAAAMSCLMQHLRGSTCVVKSRSLLVGLLRAHAALCCQEESLACMLGGASGEDGAEGASAAGMRDVLVARYHLASCLRCYVEAAEPWQPLLLQQVFWGTPAPGMEPGQMAAQTPSEMFAAACLLGDLFPPEWPAAGRKATQAPPADRKYRAALATAIEPCGASFRRLIAAALTSESRLLRAAVVRVLARAAGLGGGMGPFLVEPLLEELGTVAESPAPLHDARRLLEVIVPLVYRPAIKSAMLAAPFTSTLAQLLGVMVGMLSSSDEGSEAAHVCTMAMEAVVVMFNSEVCLNPLAPVPQQQLEDMPPIEEAVPMARTLLELLPGMGSNAMIAHRVLRLMAAAESGRLALRRAVVLLHAAATGAEPPTSHPGTIAVAQAAQWMANRYWAAAERLGNEATAAGGAGLENLRSVLVDVVSIMQQICVAVDDDSLPKPPSAQQRFVAALQAALHAAAEAGLDVGGDEHRWEAPGSAEARAADMVFDPATRMFWRNVRTRASAPGQASSAHAMRRFARRECQADVDPDVSVATSLHPPLTLPRQQPELPPLMENPQQRQKQQQPEQRQPKAETAQQSPAIVRPQHHRAAGAGTAAGAAPPSAARGAVKSEPQLAPAVAAVQPLPPSQAMDLYADLGAGLLSTTRSTQGGQHQSAAGSTATLSAAAAATAVAAAAPAAKTTPQQQQQQQQRQAANTTLLRQAQQHSVSQPGKTKQIVPRSIPARAAAGSNVPSERPVESASSGSLQALLSNPAALQALLTDRAQLQKLLEKHPSLISELRSTLGKGG